MLLALLAFVAVSMAARQQWEEPSPLDRQQWEVLRYRDPKTGTIPPEAAARDAALARILQRTETKRPRTASVLVEPIGPVNVAGRTRALAVDSRASSVLMCGGVTGGVWRSIDRGRSWVRMTSPLLVPHVSCIVQSRSAPDTWYIGTGEGLSTTERRTSTQLRTVGTGTGIYRSTDNGTSWYPITPPVTEQPNVLSRSPWQIVWRLAVVSDAGQERLYAACYGGIYAWDGNTWRLEVGDSSQPAFATDIVAAGGSLYAAIGATDDGLRPPYYGIFERRGGSWRSITPPAFPTVRRIVLAVSADGSILYAFAQRPRSWNDRYTSFSSEHVLWRYSAATGQWQDRTAWLALLQSPMQTPLETLGGYCMTIAVYPTNPDIVYVGGTDLYASHDGCRSSAFHLGGYPYTVEPGALHPDIHAVVFDPNDPSRLYAATDGGVYLTTSPLTQGEHYWEALTNGLTTTQTYHVAHDPFGTDQFVIAGFQDNSNWYSSALAYGAPWTFAGGGDGCRVLVGSGRQLVFATSQFGYVYALDASSDAPRFIQLPSPPRSGTAFVTEIAYDRTSQQLVLALDSDLYRLRVTPTETEREWTRAAALPAGELITTIALWQTTALVGTASGTLYTADLITGRVEPIAIPLPRGSFVAAIEWDRADRSHIVVTVSNYTLPSIFASWDGGNTWQSVGGSLDEEHNGWGPSVRVVRVLDRNGKRLYIAGTSIGAFVADSLHAGTQWQPIGTTTLGVLPVEAVETRSSDGLTLFGTHGGGIYACYLDPSTIGGDVPTVPNDFLVEECTPHPVVEYTTIGVHVPRSGGIVRLELFDALGRKLLERLRPATSAGTVSIVLSQSDLSVCPAGTYFYRVAWEDRVVSGKFVRQSP